MKPAIAITVGDYNGIGPEVTLKCVATPSVRRICTPILVGPLNAFLFYARRLRLPVRFREYTGERHLSASTKVVDILESSAALVPEIRPGRISRKAGTTAGEAIEHAVKACRAGIAEAVVTAPVSKQALHRGGIRFPGQTEMLRHLTSSNRVAMLLVSNRMRVGLVTIHIPVRKVADTLSRSLVRQKVALIHDSMVKDFAIPKPRLAVLALNPHAGEGGDIGSEEDRIIAPVIRESRAKQMRIEGPFPADSFFGRYRRGDYDVVIAMYHDQGLIPLKMSSFGTAVNVSVGLPIVRTSPDHGTAFDIAGKGIADPRSMMEAVRLAAAIARQRRNINPGHRR